jgi:hypothetical protein
VARERAAAEAYYFNGASVVEAAARLGTTKTAICIDPLSCEEAQVARKLVVTRRSARNYR